MNWRGRVAAVAISASLMTVSAPIFPTITSAHADILHETLRGIKDGQIGTWHYYLDTQTGKMWSDFVPD